MSVKTNLTDNELSSYSFTVEVPNLNPADMSGSTGNISITTAPIPDYQFLRNSSFELSDSRIGSVAGIVGSLDNQNGGLTITGESLLRKLTATVTVPPKYLASTAECMDAALSLAGFSSSGLPTSNSDAFPGWYGTLLDYVKHFCAVYRMEYYLQKDSPSVLLFRSVGEHTL